MPNGESATLTPKEHLLVEKSEQGLKAAAPLLSWFKAAYFSGNLKLIDLYRSDRSTAQWFSDEVELEGKRTTTMGCIQSIRFRQAEEMDRKPAPETLRHFVQRRFFQVCHWTNADCLPGGFGITPVVAKLISTGNACSLPKSGSGSDLDLGLVGKHYDWMTFQIDLHDFVRNIPRLRAFVRILSPIIKEGVYVTIHQDYMSGNFREDARTVDECELGYAFCPATVHPNFFGYGPGRFGRGFKLFRFALLDTREIEVQMVFVSEPRSERILHILGWDPVYPTVHLVDRLLGKKHGIRRRVHNMFDTTFMKQHAVCHQSVMEGMRCVLETINWVVDSDRL